jgi:hypothetical protein
MSQYHITRIASVLDQHFGSLVDMSDCGRFTPKDARSAFLSRALAAICIKAMAEVEDKIAADSVVDGFDDGGIDAILFDQVNGTFYFVQSKWSEEGNTPLNGNSSGKFADGVRDILSGKIDRFNQKIKNKEPEILAALTATRLVKVILITVHTAIQELGPHGRRKIDDLIQELNVPSLPDQANAIHLNQNKVYGLITSFTKPPKIDLPITLANWGVTDQPFLAYYGRANVIEVAGWWREHGTSLCDRNIRHFFQRSDVNDALRDTLAENPDYFWYFNNGITVICDSVQKSLAGSPGREVGLFNCRGVSVVNGAQTVGIIGAVIPYAGAASDSIQSTLTEQSWVQVRIISLEKCPPGFDRKITQATNFQNAVVYRDFAAMDPVQHRLATDFALDHRRYVYKTGEEDPHGEEGCSITEATQALGCAVSMDVAVQVKRGIGEIWRQTDRPPYIDLFNDSLTSVHLWKAVLILRAVDEELQKYRMDLTAVHLNRALLHIVFQDPRIRDFRRDSVTEKELLPLARAVINEIFPKAVAFIKNEHPSDYLGSFCKNAVKCKKLATALTNEQTQATATIKNQRIDPLPNLFSLLDDPPGDQ